MLPIRRSEGWFPSIFTDFFENDPWLRFNSTAPAVNVIEDDQEYRLEIAAPGMNKEHFCISLTEDNHLVVTMENAQANKEDEKKEKYLRREFSYSKFERSILLPDNILRDEIKAKMENGVLHISVPKNKVAVKKPKEIRIGID